jgi:uncharacterized protein with ATP-grasp and redox domains
MRAKLQCASCVIDDLRAALETTLPDEATRLAILNEALLWLGHEFDVQRIPSYYITRVHRLLKQRSAQEMPFRSLRERCNVAGLAICERLAGQMAELSDELERMRCLMLWTIAGNHLDFRTVGTGYDLSTDDIAGALEKVVSEGLAIDDTAALLALARQGVSVLYLADNVGEIALDTLLVAELQRYGCQVTVAVKGGPITSDAVWSDAQAVGMHRLARVILSGPDTLGLSLDEMSSDVRDALQGSELVISKGQANYYACSELASSVSAEFFCLLRTKCGVAANSLGLQNPRLNVAVRLARPGLSVRDPASLRPTSLGKTNG